MTTTDTPRRKRASKGLLRTWAWVVGAISFFGPATAIGLQPPDATASQSQPQRSPDVVIRHVVRRIVIHERPRQTTGGAAAVYSSPTQAVAAPPPPPPPTATTRGS